MIKNCLVCNKEFITYPSKIFLGKGKYCSKKCCLEITNKVLEYNGTKTRFYKNQIPHNFKGETITQSRKDGKKYKHIFNPEHPLKDKDGYVREHRLVMEKYLNRYLDKNEIVHHLDGNTLNNKIENLKLVSGKEHRVIHLKDSVHKRWLKTSAPVNVCS